MASDKKVQQITAFNSGEYSDKLAGRVDIEPFAHSARLISNFMAEPTGGLKKFYGTDFITEIEDPTELVMVPFINSYGTMALVMKPGKVGLLWANTYSELEIDTPNVRNLSLLRWQQINDRLIFVHPDRQPFSIDFYGMTDEGEPRFLPGTISFDEVPYFPIGYTGEYNKELVANGIAGTVTLTIPADTTEIAMPWPEPLVNTSDWVRTSLTGEYIDDNGNYYHKSRDVCSVEPMKVEIVRVRGGGESVIASATIDGKFTLGNGSTSYDKNPDWPSSIMTLAASVRPGIPGLHPGTVNTPTYTFNDTLSREMLAKALRGTVFNRTSIQNNVLVLVGDEFSDHLEGDSYYMRLTTYDMKVDGYVVRPADGPYTTSQVFVAQNKIDVENVIGRKLKVWMNTDEVITPWWQGREIKTGDTMPIVYSNGHYYRCASASGTCGNIQPSHLKGYASDGGVDWLYLHSGYVTGTIVGADETHITLQLPDGAYMPILSTSERRFKTFQWSIWGKGGVHPSQIYMQNNRLGLICNTESFGAWNSLSCSDNYFDFSTEQYGQQLDTSAIVHLIPNNPDNKINWVLSFNQLYLGSYSGEFTIGAPNKTVLTPTTLMVNRVSVLGGTNVMPLKYKELNLFVGSTGQELYTVGYDYTRDDYVPKSLGYLTEHLLEQGIKRMEAINNRDQNVYLVHDNGNLSILNYVSDQQILGYSRVNLEGFVRDFCYTYSNQTRAAYVAVQRRDGYVCLEMVSLYEPTYMLSTEYVPMSTSTTYAAPRFAGKKVYLVNVTADTFELVDWPEDGIMPLDCTTGDYIIGQEMTCELHTQPAFGRKAEGLQQQAIMMSLRLLESGTFEFGASNDFKTMFPYKVWGKDDAWGEWHKTFTGDATLNIPTGYAKNANEGTGPYANSTGIGINIRATTPEPFNLLSIMEVYQ